MMDILRSGVSLNVITATVVACSIASVYPGCKSKRVEPTGENYSGTKGKTAAKDTGDEVRTAKLRLREGRYLEALEALEAADTGGRGGDLNDRPFQLILKAQLLVKVNRVSEGQVILERLDRHFENQILAGNLNYDPVPHAFVLAELGGVALDESRIPEARRQLQRAADLLGGYAKEHPEGVAKIFTQLSMVEFYSRKYQAALKRLEHAATVLKQTGWKTPYQLAWVIEQNRGVVLSGMGEYGAARQAFQTALLCLDAKNGTDPEMLISTLGDLAEVQIESGDLSGASSIMDRLETVVHSSVNNGELHTVTFIEAHLLRARLLLKQGKYREALALSSDASRLLEEKAIAATRRDVDAMEQTIRRIRGRAYALQGRHFEAMGEFRNLVDSLPNHSQVEPHALPSALCELATFLYESGDEKGAVRAAQEAAVNSSHSEWYSRDQVENWLTIGSILRTTGELPNSENALLRALDGARALFPEERYPLGSSCHAVAELQLGFLCNVRGETSRSQELVVTAAARTVDLVKEQICTGAEANSFVQLARTNEFLGGLLSIPVSFEQLADRLDRARMLKGLFFRSMRYRFARMRRLPARLQAKGREYLEVRRRLAEYSMSDMRTRSASVDDARELLERRKSRLERELAGVEVPGSGESSLLEVHSTEQLRQALASDEVLIEWFKYSDAFERRIEDAGRYAAFLVTPDGVQRVDFDARTLENAAAEWVAQVRRGRVDAGAKQEIRSVLWEPLAEWLPAGTRRIYLCPDGKMGTIPWAALPCLDEAGKPNVLLERFTIDLLPTSDVLCERSGAEQAGPFILVGNLDYGERFDARGRRVEDGTKAWPALAHTESELADIERMAGGRTVRRLEGIEAPASEVLDSLKTASSAHFATHGFATSGVVGPIRQTSFGFATEPVITDNPLLSSGLVLSDANASISDGYLSSEEIASLPLDQLQLAVLSACDSGRGPVALGEGMLGLRRAFHMAGTRNVIASLWRVDDRATAVLMRLFYRYLWEERLTPSEALRQAQLTIYRNPGVIDQWSPSRGLPVLSEAPATDEPRASSRGPDAHLHLWAGFMLSGPGH